MLYPVFYAMKEKEDVYKRQFISGQGEARIAMLSVLIGAIINICLDPVFIFVFGMGVKGCLLYTS